MALAQKAGLKAPAAEAALRKVEKAVGTFSGVAKELGLTPATTKRVVKRLEEVRRDYER